MTRRATVSAIAHAVAIAAVLVALSPWGRSGGGRPRVVVAFDASASVAEAGASPRDRADPFAARVGSLDGATVVDGIAFGAAAAPWFAGATPATLRDAMRAPLPPLDPWASSPTDALVAARRSLGRRPGTVVLVTDGGGVDDAAVAVARSLHAAGHVVHVVPIDAVPPTARPFIADVRAPLRVVPGAPIAIDVAVAARGAAPSEAVVVVREVGGDEQRRPVAVPPTGAIRVVVPFAGRATADVRRFSIALDGVPADAARRATVDVAVGDAVRIGAFGRTPAWAERLGDGFAVRAVDDAAAPVDVLVVDGLAFGPPPLDARAAAAIVDAVRDGTALLAVAGSVGFGPGGWRDSPLASALPVRIERAGPDADVCLLVDRSGSMAAAARWPTAVRAATAVIAGLGTRDRVRVATFAADVAEAVAWRDARTAGPAVARALGAVRPGGPTNLAAALESVAFPTTDDASRRRLLIVSSDGRLAEAADRYRAIGGALRDRGIHVGVVQSDGASPAPGLVALTLDGANGRVVVAGAGDLADAFRAAADTGWWIDPAPVVRAVAAAPAPPDGGWPRPARVSTTRRADDGRVVAEAGQAPLIAIGRHGLGAVAVAALDPGGSPWAGPAPWRALLRGLLADGAVRAVRGRVVVRGGEAAAELRVPGAGAVGSWVLRWGALRIPFEPDGPGALRTAPFAAPGRSAAPAPAFAEADGRRVRLAVADVPGAELAVDPPDRARAARLAAAGGGRVLDPGEPLPARPDRGGGPAWPWAALALVALLVGRAVKFAPSAGR